MIAKLNPQVPSSPSSTSLVGKLNFPGFQEVLDFEVPTVDTYTKCLLHFNGADAATSTVEETGKVVTFVGTAQLDTAQSKFGGSSLLLDGNSDYVTLADSTDWDFGSGDFTVDFWVRFAVDPTGVSTTFYSQKVDDNNRISITKRGDNNAITFFTVSAGSVANTNTSESLSWSAGTWYHIAVVRTGTTLKFFRDGVELSKLVTNALGTLPNIAGTLSIAYDNNYLNGWFDEYRVSKGIARWTSNFTPPTSEYTDVYAAVSVAVDGDTDKEYKIVARNLGSQAIRFRLNTNSTAGAYGYQQLANASGSISAGRGTADSLISCPTIGELEATLLTPTGFLKTAFGLRTQYGSGTTMAEAILWGGVFNSTANITVINCDSASGNFTAGTRIVVYARRSNV